MVYNFKNDLTKRWKKFANGLLMDDVSVLVYFTAHRNLIAIDEISRSKFIENKIIEEIESILN